MTDTGDSERYWPAYVSHACRLILPGAGFLVSFFIGGSTERGVIQTLDLSAEPETRKGPREFGPAHAIWFVPALALGALLSIPVGLVLSAIVKRREHSFKNGMKVAGRVMNHRDFEHALHEGRGTLIIESHSLKGPFRWWWTGESVYDLCPHPLVTWFMSMPNDERYRPLAEWCRREYTNGIDGRALLVDLASPEEQGGFNIDRTAVRSAKMKWLEIAPPERLRHYRN